MAFTKFTHTLLKYYQTSRRPSIKCTEHQKGEMSDNLFYNFYRFRKDFSLVVNSMKSSKSETHMTSTKFTHTLLKHHQASWRPNMECMEHKHVLKNANADLKK